MDVDPTAKEGDILEAIRAAAAQCAPQAEGEMALTTVTGLWLTRSGMQVAAVKIHKTLLGKLDRLSIGWTIAKIRAKAPMPARCYKCHGFGHTRHTCTGPDLTSACRRCGERGHLEVKCTAGNNRCVACQREGHKSTEYRTGSAGCFARRHAQTELRDGVRGRRDASAERTTTGRTVEDG